ncbi:MAG: oligosaccharide flippase family protein [Candidatus Nanoarchaeia archaeon]|nr:oligosaccharide flippase family protein [Candidatus Nanoarchaeia archaeon]
MHKKIIEFIKKEKIFHSSILLVSSTLILYLCNFFYHFYTGRVLGPENYSIIGSLFSLIYVIFVPFNAIQISVTKFVSEFNVKNEQGKIKFLLTRSLKKLFIYGIFITIFFMLISPFISNFLNIPSYAPVMILGLVIFASLLLPVTRGVLQGLQSFKKFGINMASEGITKVIFTVLLVSVGFGVNGATLALVLSFSFAFLFTLWQLRDIFKYKEIEIETKQVYKYSWPVLITFLALTLIFSLDILLVKHFFDPIQAGYYAALSLIGKIVYFTSFPVIQVMFPMVSEANIKKQHKKELIGLLFKAMLIIFLICLGITGFYFIFPNFMVNLLFGADYSSIIPLIGYFGIFMSLFSLVYLFAFYNLSLNQKGFIPLLVLTNILEIIVIYLFHNTILQIITSLSMLTFLLLISLVIYTFYKHGKTISNNSSV